jgi:hypothetical protein
MATFTKLEKAFSKAVTELERAMLRVRGMKVVRSVKQHIHRRQRGLTSGILKIIGKMDGPAKVSDIVKRLPSLGYKVRNPQRVKLSIGQTLHRLVGAHRIVRSGRGLYKPAAVPA